MFCRHSVVAWAALVVMASGCGVALADDHAYTEGPVVSMGGIRTVDGRFDEYMKYLGGSWKQEMEAAKKAGLILDYKVIMVEPRGVDDPDLYLVITYKNWATMDGFEAKFDAVIKQFEGSVAASSQAMTDRNKIRRPVGSWTGQYLDLK